MASARRLPYSIEDEAFLSLVNELGWLSPYYLEAIAVEIIPSGAEQPNGRTIATANDVGSAFDALIALHNRNYFSSWREHISKNFDSPIREQLYEILQTCTRHRDGEEFDTLLVTISAHESVVSPQDLRDILDVLVNDGYLVEDTTSGKFGFSSGLVRRWWMRWMCEAGEPKSEE